MTTLTTTPVNDKIWDTFEALSEPDGFVPVNRLAYLGLSAPTRRPTTSIYYSPTSSGLTVDSGAPLIVQPVKVSVALVRERFLELLDGAASKERAAVCLDLYPGDVFVLSGTPRVVAARLLGLDVSARVWSHASFSRHPFA